MSSVLPAQAVKWEDLGDGMYMDMDSISESGSQLSTVYKVTNKDMLELFTLANQIDHPDKTTPPLSVCLMQNAYDCSTSKPVSLAILCYDKSGNTAIDIVESDPAKTGAKNMPNIGSGICDMYRMMKKDLTK